MLQTGRSQVRFLMVSGFFSMTWSCRSHYGPGVDCASNRNEYQVFFLSSGMLLWVKVAGAYGWQPTTITVPLSRKLGTLTLLDPSGPAWPVGGWLYLTFCHLLVNVPYLCKGHCISVSYTTLICMPSWLFMLQVFKRRKHTSYICVISTMQWFK